MKRSARSADCFGNHHRGAQRRPQMLRIGVSARAAVLATALMAVASTAQAQRPLTVPPDSTMAGLWIGFARGVRDVMEPDRTKRRLPVVRSVIPCSPAHYAGLEPGDLLVLVNGQDARMPNPFRGGEGSEYDVVAERDGKRLTFLLRRERRPEQTLEPVSQAPIGDASEWDCPLRVG